MAESPESGLTALKRSVKGDVYDDMLELKHGTCNSSYTSLLTDAQTHAFHPFNEALAACSHAAPTPIAPLNREPRPPLGVHIVCPGIQCSICSGIAGLARCARKGSK